MGAIDIASRYLCIASLFVGMPGVATAGPRVIASTDQVGDASSGAKFSFFEFPTINKSGQVAFQGWLEEPVVTGNARRGVWRGDLQHLVTIMQGGRTVPSTMGDGQWTGGEYPVLLDNGAVAFLGGVDAEPTGFGGIFRHRPGAGSQWATYFDTASNIPADPPGDRFRTLSSVFSNPVAADGTAASRVHVTYGDSRAAAIFVGKPGAIVKVAQTGEALPGGATPFMPHALSDPRVSRSGRAVFNAYSDNRIAIGGTEYPDEGVWCYNGVETLPIMRTGGQALALPSGTKFRGVDSDRFSINDAGRIALIGSYRDRPSGGPASGSAVWTGLLGGGWRVVATQGQQAPGVPTGATFGQFYDAILSSGEDVVFTSRLGGSNSAYFDRVGIWTSGGIGDLRKVAVVGEPAPGVGDSMIFQHLGQPSVNDAGVIVFDASFGPFGTTTTIPGAIFVSDILGLRALMVPGDEVRVGPGDVRIVSSAFINVASGGDDGIQSCLNDRGQVAARVSFTDGTMAIVRMDVPCPGTLLAIGLPLCTRQRRKAPL